LMIIPCALGSPPSCIQAMAVAAWWCRGLAPGAAYISLTHVHIYGAYARNVVKGIMYDICITGVNR